jgi:hypothetical protein
VSRKVKITDFTANKVVKFWPSLPPYRGDVVLVNGARGKVKRAKVKWNENRWTIYRLVVKLDKEHKESLRDG